MGRAVVLLVAAVLGAGCQDVPVVPTPIVNPPTGLPLTISSVSPAAGWPFYYTVTVGSGIKPGARVTFGGVEAPSSMSGVGLVTNPPWHDPGPVDVAVTNPDGSGWKSKMLLQVHDELVFDVHNDELEKIQPMIKFEMENAFKMDVPLDVEIGMGKNWLEAH